jgi:hypothetical protein
MLKNPRKLLDFLVTYIEIPTRNDGAESRFFKISQR